MSLFPIRLKPGGTITVHLRFFGREPVWIQRKDFLVNPKGERKLCYERSFPYIPREKRSEEEYELINKSGQILQGAPLLMAARYLQNDLKRTDYFMDMLVGLRDDMHHYYTLKIPEDAALGRYHFELEDRMNGRLLASKTADTDWFLVEKLENKGLLKREGKYLAIIENPGPEAVLAQLCEFSLDPTKPHRQKIIKLAANTSSEVVFEESALLIYCDGEDFLRLNQEKGVLRNPIYQSIFNENYILIFSDKAEGKHAFELVGEAEQIWKLADGFLPRTILRTPARAARYDEMLSMGMILEID